MSNPRRTFGVGGVDTRETYQEQQLRKEQQARSALNRRIVRHVASCARDASDARLLLGALGLDPAEGRG